jgi:cell division protein FtsZ
MVFIAAGMGGGTGTGAAPVIARAAREQGILTVGVVTKPFHFEGAHRMRIAETGIEELEQFVDTLIVIPNQNLFRIANDKTTFADAFKMADDVLYSGVRGVTDLMVVPGLINLDFADVRAVMSEMGKAMMGTGQAEGERRALDAAEAAICNPLLEDVSLKGARGVLINITGSPDLTLFEVDEAVNRIRGEVDPDAFIIFGSTFDPEMQGRIRVSVVATGMDVAAAVAAKDGSGKLNFEALDREGASASSPVRPEAVLRLSAADLIGGGRRSETAVDGIPGETAPAAAATEHGGQGAASDPVPPLGSVFIPPAPVSRGAAARRSLEAVPSEPAGRVAAAADPQAPGTLGRVGNLFARMTGGARTRPVGQNATAETGDRGQGAAKGAVRLGGMSAEERLPTSRTEEDLLEIPAFLRRQAN